MALLSKLEHAIYKQSTRPDQAWTQALKAQTGTNAQSTLQIDVKTLDQSLEPHLIDGHDLADFLVPVRLGPLYPNLRRHNSCSAPVPCLQLRKLKFMETYISALLGTLGPISRIRRLPLLPSDGLISFWSKPAPSFKPL